MICFQITKPIPLKQCYKLINDISYRCKSTNQYKYEFTFSTFEFIVEAVTVHDWSIKSKQLTHGQIKQHELFKTFEWIERVEHLHSQSMIAKMVHDMSQVVQSVLFI